MEGAIETLRQNVATQSVVSPVGTEVMEEVRGSYRGERVEVSSVESQLEDAKEEIGMSVAHRADKRTLGQREIRQGRGSNINALARIADYYDKLPDMPHEDALASLVEQMQNFADLLDGDGGSEVTIEDLFRALQAFDGDPTHQFAALELARDVFAASGASNAFLALLDEAAAAFQTGDLGRDTRAGFAAAEVANRAAQTLETDPAAVREAYRDLLRENTRDMGALFDMLRRFDVMKSMEEIVGTFIEVAGRDLSAASPSSDPIFLHSLVTELAKLKKMQTAIDLCAQLTRSVDRLLQPGELARGTPVDVASRMLAFASREGPGLQDARQLMSRYEKSSAATQVAFANGLRAIHLDLPDEVMPSLQARLNQTKALMRLLDELVEAEEEDYEGRDRDDQHRQGEGKNS
ncbi:HrpJ domain-containing protein [Rhizobium oryzicola]|uniref:HrpJ domain-containing protein n=1 Tax=Rhizobium oryzicola TaxID=1232668 RepID=A0ABT8SXL2_9HYPH|nr:HrpJ domain-containing protein [Rhizobium oryzicola]MDO1583194.1 HrpJ domain-containing protein [Rhizobium oryzicola]